MSVEHCQTRPGAYADSVTLMQVSATVGGIDGVEAALIAMATELNLGLLSGLGFTAPAHAGPNDLLVAVRARDSGVLAEALTVLAAALEARPAAADHGAAAQQPRTVGSAARRTGPALALISVPGRHAFAEAMDALEAGCDVMIFSDNVPVDQEIALKDAATRRGLLVMGPDCGTAVVGGVGLGFSHTLAPGPVGLVAASGTGAQQLLCLLDAAGVGVSAALGVGGRDLSAAVGGRSSRTALAALDEDPATELIVVVSKPPTPEVAAALRGHAESLATPVIFAFTGPGEPDLTAAAEAALKKLGMAVPQWPRWDPADGAAPPPIQARPGNRADGAAPPPIPARPGSSRAPGAPATSGEPAPPADAAKPGWLRGLFAGGTLCGEAMVIARQRLGPISSNIPLDPRWRIDPATPATGHVMIDFGDDALTAGRPHPMIDPALRLERLAAEAADPATAVLLLDIVLGHGAHPDPAAVHAPVITAARTARDLPVVVSLIGAASDPQDRDRQAAALRDAGAHVFLSNAQAARFACDLIVSRG